MPVDAVSQGTLDASPSASADPRWVGARGEAPEGVGGRAIPESFVAWLWEHRRAGASLTTADGRQVQVIYPGRRWGSWGPDFRGALLAIDGAVARGDVEIHRRAQDWRAHGHHRDSAYAHTVLHVVFEPPRGNSSIDETLPPTVALAPIIGPRLASLLQQWQLSGSLSPVEPACQGPEEAARLLTAAGLARFQQKAARFEGDLACLSPLEALLGGVLETLGYANNVAPFRRLGERIHLGEALARARVDGAAAAAAVLLGESGLLPSQRGRLPPVDDDPAGRACSRSPLEDSQRRGFPLDDYTLDIEARWRATGRPGPREPLGWRWVGCRPSNGPVRRVAAAAALLAHPAAASLDEAALRALGELPPPGACVSLRRLLLRPGDDYWQHHGDFGCPMARPSSLLGAERAADAVANAVLPWALAMGRSRGVPWLAAAALAAYQAHPPLSSNQITRHMARQLVGDAARQVVTSAARQQGLIYLYQGWCDRRDCSACPAGGAHEAWAIMARP